MGLSNKKRKEFLTKATRKVMSWADKYKKGFKIDNNLIPLIQENLMDATGSTIKEVYYLEETLVNFKGNDLSASNPLKGKGKNELEAICNACYNFIGAPSYYNSFSKEYVDKIKAENNSTN